MELYVLMRTFVVEGEEIIETLGRRVKQMTSERAVEILNLDLDILGQYGDKTAEAYKMAIKALKEQPQTIVMTKEEFERYLANEDLVVVKRKFLNGVLETQPCEEDFVKHKKEVLERIAKREREIDKYIKELETLKQQPCEDCISRQEMLSLHTEYAEKMSATTFWKLRDDIRKLPSVKPQYTDEEIDKAQAVEQAYVDKMVELAVEETKRPKGKWIKYKSRFGTEYFKCSECGRKLNWIDSDDNYCNSCGSDNSESTKELYKEKLAEMSGGGEDETDS